LEKHGFYFDGEPLKKLIEEKVNDLARYQRKGQIDKFYAYFKHSWERYIREEADQLSNMAKTMGYHISAQYNKAIKGLKTIPQLESQSRQESLREQIKKHRKKYTHAEANKNQITMF